MCGETVAAADFIRTLACFDIDKFAIAFLMLYFCGKDNK